MAKVPEKARNGSKANVLGERSWGMSKDCTSKETNSFEADEDPLSETGCFDMASIKVECTGDRVSTSVRRKPQASHWNRLMCSSDIVPEDSG